MTSRPHAIVDTYLKKSGYLTARVEFYNTFSGRSNDLFGLFDLLAVNGKELLAVQVTSKNKRTEHIKQWLESPNLAVWLKSGQTAIMMIVDTDLPSRTPASEKIERIDFRISSHGRPEIVLS